MNRNELIAHLDELGQSLKEEHPNAAIVILTLRASMIENTDHLLAELAQRFSGARLEAIDKEENEKKARLN